MAHLFLAISLVWVAHRALGPRRPPDPYGAVALAFGGSGLVAAGMPSSPDIEHSP